MFAAIGLTVVHLAALLLCAAPKATERFEGRYFSGAGDVEYLQLLDMSRRMFAPDPEFQNVPMLYTPAWNGLVEGPTWNAWWIQNSYGPTYCALPFYEEPLITFLQNAQDLWFDQMGDGRTVRPFKHGDTLYNWIPPDGALCDAASPGRFIAKQGDGRVDLHDWGMEFTAAGLLMQAELLLISRDAGAIAHYLPRLDRCAAFIETRRDPANDLFLAGPAGNLLAPSYAGWKKPDGTYSKAYLTGLSVTYIAGLDRLIELHKLAGDREKVDSYREQRDRSRRGLDALVTEEGYLIRSLDPDGTKHGVYGAEKHGYFESSPNHDAVCFRVVDDAQARRIYDTIASIDGLRPHHFIIPNYPSYDDMYTEPVGLWSFGRWVNGGHWSTCEARMIMGYYRLGRYEDARGSMQQLLNFARQFRMDNPLVDFGSNVYQPREPINLCYDAFGPPAGMIRGLFEYLYRADDLTLIPHVPSGILELVQRFPIRFGDKRIYLATRGAGEIRHVFVNNRPWELFTPHTVTLPYDRLPDTACVEIIFGDAERAEPLLDEPTASLAACPFEADFPPDLRPLHPRLKAMDALAQALDEAGLGESYEAAHARLAVTAAAATCRRRRMLADGQLPRLPDASQKAADASYVQTTQRLVEGLEAVLAAHGDSDDPRESEIFKIWADLSHNRETPSK